MPKAKRILAWIALVLLVVVVAAVAAGMSFRAALGPAVEASPPRAVHAPHGVVATSQPLASQAGLAVLQREGNAVDAAVVFGGGQAIMRKPRGYVAGSDSRRDGLAAAH